jgi:hypothetical protein
MSTIGLGLAMTNCKPTCIPGYAHDWEFFSRILSSNEKWVCTKKPTLIYNAATSGQEEFLLAKAKAASDKK